MTLKVNANEVSSIEADAEQQADVLFVQAKEGEAPSLERRLFVLNRMKAVLHTRAFHAKAKNSEASTSLSLQLTSHQRKS